ncbi:MAG: glycosyltransferase, partial [Actinomycetota bacterium]
LEDRVLVPGWLSDPDPAIAAADVFVSTSLWEGFPLAALESAAGGLPLIVTDVAGNRDLVASGVPACLVPAQDPGRLADELRLARVRLAGRNDPESHTHSWIAKEFSRENLGADVRRAYGAVLGEWRADTVEERSTSPEGNFDAEVKWAG